MRRVIREVFAPAILAGACIGLGGAAWLIVENKYAAAFLFCLGLFTVCVNKLWLFTGKIGYVVTDPYRGKYCLKLAVTWIGNFIGVLLIGMMLNVARPGVETSAIAVMQLRLAQPPYATIFLSMLCGVIMYVAVDAYVVHHTTLGILLGIPVFLLCGFEHSIADMFYMTTAKMITAHTLAHILLVTFGNALGSVVACALMPATHRLIYNRKHGNPVIGFSVLTNTPWEEF